ncbi:iron-containing alcohol dehydrogenase [Halalkalibacter krulwichiae]|uniref:1,3-propanediol dehydrogenase n=1 Tax=Halalkalibacter krulwichiae TaxID=199441 RepID=A0A1X9MDY7_9BACI|nr:iron-containing alcohol dehydrogenase [Halalkalibacter krulwichiae]ARK28652.1 1,3-propanediol dehydrogenase [Halalkalibacter krulwichiae]
MNLLSRVFSYELPTEIVFGINSIEQLSQKVRGLQGNRVLVITDPGVKDAGILDKLIKQIDADISFDTFWDIEREPDVKTIRNATEKAKEFGADLIVGIGGGSALDAAKAVAIMLNNDGDIIDYAGLNNVPNPSVPTICIPTTSGTGSEVTIWTVISDKDNNRKFGIGGKSIAPTMALCDPNLTTSLPGLMTAATGVDALTHALESFVNKATQPISQALSRESMRLIFKSLRKAVHQGDNLEARYDMLLASTIAATAFNPTRLGLAHALCMPLGAKFKVPHGIANAILLPQVMEFNIIGNPEAFKEIAEIFGENTEGLSLYEAAELSVKAIKKLNQDAGIPAGFAEFGVTEEDLDYIAEGAIGSDNVLVNPRKPSLEDLKEIVRKSL